MEQTGEIGSNNLDRTLPKIRERKGEDKQRVQSLAEEIKTMTPEGIARKILASQRRREKETHWKNTDQLTGLPRRNPFIIRTKHDIEIVKRNPGTLGLTFTLADIDNFGKFNKVYGEDVGDKVLKIVGSTLQSKIRTTDMVCRWGGEEFPITMPHSTKNTDDGHTEVLRNKCELESIEEIPEKITMTFGSTDYREGDDFKSLFSRAATALRMAKLLGKRKTIVAKENIDGKEMLKDLVSGKEYSLEKNSEGKEKLTDISEDIKYMVDKDKNEKPILAIVAKATQ